MANLYKCDSCGRQPISPADILFINPSHTHGEGLMWNSHQKVGSLSINFLFDVNSSTGSSPFHLCRKCAWNAVLAAVNMYGPEQNSGKSQRTIEDAISDTLSKLSIDEPSPTHEDGQG